MTPDVAGYYLYRKGGKTRVARVYVSAMDVLAAEIDGWRAQPHVHARDFGVEWLGPAPSPAPEAPR